MSVQPSDVGGGESSFADGAGRPDHRTPAASRPRPPGDPRGARKRDRSGGEGPTDEQRAAQLTMLQLPVIAEEIGAVVSLDGAADGADRNHAPFGTGPR